MSARVTAAPKALLAGLLAMLLFAGTLGGLATGTARADSSPADPADPATPVTVTADALPTVQINGVVWQQLVVGNTVYVGGEFTKARPAGAPAGTNETTRNNLLAYDIRTGELLTGFAPDLNGQVKALAASPDGSRLYVGGSFTRADGQARYRIAAYDTATGALDPTFKPAFDSQVKAIAVSDTTVYAGGIFKAVGQEARTRLAAVSRSNGALLPWAPVADSQVTALALTPNGSKVVAGGSFTTLGGPVASGGQVAQGIGAIDAASGQAVPFAVGRVVNNTGSTAAVLSLSVDDDTVYASGYTFGKGNLEGVAAADPETGAVRWIEDCHGDSYSVWASGTVAYVAGHPHVCSNIGGWPQTDPWSFYRGIAFSKAATGTVGTETGNFVGQPAPSLLNWFPTIDAGTYTGQAQGPWSVAGNDQYVVYGGEFPTVNGVAQQGLVRFAVPSIAPNAIGPSYNAQLTPTVTPLDAGVARVSWTASSDRDNENLTYRVYRDGDTTTPVHTVTRASRFWNAPVLTFIDRGLPAGSHRYRVTVTDPMGNRSTSDWTTVETAGGPAAPARPYAETVAADGAQDHWPLGEAPGSTTAYDHAGGQDLTVGAGVTAGRSGALAGDTDTAFEFDGTQGLAATRTAIDGPQTFTVEAWFQTTSWSGGKIVGFGSANTGLSGSYDRHVYMDGTGRVSFGVYPGSSQVVRSSTRYNDGRWHHVAASLGPNGMALYVDGRLVGSRAAVTKAQAYRGYWRIGGDRSWSGAPYFNGSIDEVAVYPTALPADVVARHHTVGTTGVAPNVAPTAAFTSAVDGLSATLDASGSSDRDGQVLSWSWTLGDGATATGTTVSHTYAEAGTYPVTLTVTDDDGATAQQSSSVTVTAPPVNTAPQAAFASSVADLVASFDGSASADTDGSVVDWAWEFGDGSTGSGATVSHGYAEAGTYPVTLTVTDEDGATASVQQPVTVIAPVEVPEGPVVPALAVDSFERSVAAGLGQAET
ncbi:PKD domain-containing protein, partial [Modestobacter marinus]